MTVRVRIGSVELIFPYVLLEQTCQHMASDKIPGLALLVNIVENSYSGLICLHGNNTRSPSKQVQWGK